MKEFLRRMFGSHPANQNASESSLEAALTGRSRAERDQKHSEEEFERLVLSVRDYAIFLLDRDGYVRTWNAGAEAIKGYRAEEIIGKHFSRFYPKEALASDWPTHELKVAAATGRFEDEGWRIRKNGTRFWANVVITALQDDHGEVRAFLKITRDVTDRKQAEEKLRLSEERFRLMVDSVEDYAILMLDPEGRVATWNVGAEHIKGYRAAEIIGEHFSRFYPEEAIKSGWPEEELKRAAAEGRFEDEGWRIRKDGSRFWANVVITALRDDARTLRGFAKVTRDLTERMEAEEKSRRLLQEEAARKAAEAGSQAAERARREESRQRQQLLVTLNSIGDAVIVTDNEGIVTFLNPVAVALTDWTSEEAAGRPLEDVFQIVNEVSGVTVENPVVKVLREGVVIGLANHTVLISKTGRKIPIDDSGAPIRDDEGNISGVVLVFRDVTETRKAIETRLHLAAIVESSEDAIIGKSLDGIVLSWNRGAELLYGYAAEEILGQPLSILVPEDSPDELPEIMERIKRGESIDHFETQRQRKDGTKFDVSLTISPIRNAEGQVIGASKIARDITARKEEERHRNEFLALLAHELRNPLAPLRHGLEIMKLAGSDPTVADETCRVMEEQLQHMVRLIDDLLVVSRMSRGKLDLRTEPINLADVVKSAIETCEPLLREQRDELTVTLPEEPIHVDGDKTRLAQVLCNLLNNAAKYSEPERPIWLSLARENDQAILRLRDKGIGIPESMLPKIFDMFVQVDRSLEKSQGGLGVGLSIVKQIVEMHHGSIEAKSEGLGKGSEFIVRLPIGSADLPNDQAGDARLSPRI